MPGPPAPCFCLCHLLSSADFLLSALLPVAPAVRTLGSCAARFIVTLTSIRGQEKQTAPGAACWKKDRRPVRALAASSLLRRRDPGTGFGVVALEALLDPPPTQGCANGVTQIPGGCPAGKAVWPRLIITPGKLRGAM